ncbi:MgtC/SapB family protein (plasmid) [Nitrobacter sp. NHB1]|uniref:MgtC/SapB family protein n=1 Tax=Nitrobacter sp. NHB1 TaxID=3119830 RepID=UPI002FFF03CC
MDYEVLSRVMVSLAIGLLVGLERGWQTRDAEDNRRAAGFRTFALSGLLGGITGLIALQTGASVIGWVFLGYTAAFAAFHWLEARNEGHASVTSVVAGMLTFLLGTMAVVGDLQLAIACAVGMTVLLALREPLHRWIDSLSWQEIRAVLSLLAMSFLLLPLLPNRPVDPWRTINPYQIWLLAIMIATISFAGYVAVKAFGNRLGVFMAAVAGGLASSTATTLALAKLAREHPSSSGLLSAGILVAGVVMMLRAGAIVVALNGALFVPLIPALSTAAAVLGIGAAILWFRNIEQETPELQIRNPLEVGTAIKLAVLLAVVMLVAELVRRMFGGVGILVVAALSGIADVDAVTISIARMGGGDVDVNTAARAIMIAIAINTVSKTIMASWVGNKKVGILVGGISAIALAGGLVVAA